MREKSVFSVLAVISFNLGFCGLLLWTIRGSAQSSIPDYFEQSQILGSDLIIESLSIDPTNPAPGESITITVKVKNVGDQVLVDGFYTFLYVDPTEQPPISTTQDTSSTGWFLGLNSGGSFTWEYSGVTFTTTGCDHTIYAWVDRDNLIQEANEDNNLTNLDVCVGYTISGRVVTSTNQPIDEVFITDGSAIIGITDINGNFHLSGLAAGTITLTPLKTGYTFTPASIQLSLPPSAENQNFVGTTVVAGYSISGQVIQLDSLPIPGVKISFGEGLSVVTDENGNYQISNLSTGDYLLTPLKRGYTFIPKVMPVHVPPDANNRNFTGSPPIGPPKAWTFLLYLDGDTAAIGGDGGTLSNIFKGIIHQLGQNQNSEVNVVALFDQPGSPDTSLVTFNPLEDYLVVGEKRMDDPTTLSDFVIQAMHDFPAAHYYLAIADHSNGLVGIAYDTTTDPNRKALLQPQEIHDALNIITNDSEYPVDVIHFDGCSFGLIENAASVSEFAKYVVFTENLGWSVFAYNLYRSGVNSNTTAQQLAIKVAQGYASETGSRSYPYTISVIDTNRLPSTMAALKDFADSLINYAIGDAARRSQLETIRNESQKFDSNDLAITIDDIYLDLYDFTNRVKNQITDSEVQNNATLLMSELRGDRPLIVYESHLSGSFSYFGVDYSFDLENANGISIYYPPLASGTNYDSYRTGVTYPDLNTISHWPSFLEMVVPPPAFGDPPPEDLEPLSLLSHIIQIFLPLTLINH